MELTETVSSLRKPDTEPVPYWTENGMLFGTYVLDFVEL